MRLRKNELRAAILRAHAAFFRRCAPARTVPVVEWTRENLEYDPSSAVQGRVELRPCQLEPLQATEQLPVRQVTCMAGERGGKSLVWKASLAKRVADGGLYGWVIYQSAEAAEKTNTNSVLPMLRRLKWAADDLKSRRNVRKNAFFLPSCRSTLWFSGAAPALSETINWAVADEVDFHAVNASDAEGHNVSNITSLRKRMLTYRDTSKLIVVSSPTLYSGAIYEEWKRGSQGVWHLACLGCGELHPGNKLSFFMSAGKFAGLQWRKENGAVLPETIRYICRKCGREHVESEAAEMNRRGRYVHEADGVKAHRSYSWGALAIPDVWYWQQIAEYQERAVDPEGHKFLHNTILGFPQKPQRQEAFDDQKRVLQAKILDPYPEGAEMTGKIHAVFAGIDQQQYGVGGAKYYVYVVRAWCDNGDSYLLSEGKADTLNELRQRLSRDWHGHRLFLAAFDHGGANEEGMVKEVEEFVASDPALCFYKGAEASAKQLKGGTLAKADSNPKLFWCARVEMQVRLLDAIYGPPRDGGGYKWRLPASVSQSYLDQVGNVHPSTNRLHGDDFHLWTHSKGQRIDFFDAEKMCFAAFEIAAQFIPAQRWPRGRWPEFRQREVLAEMLRKNPALLHGDPRNKAR